MITIITGTPGAGKTLYTVEKLLLPVIGTTIEYENDVGEKIVAPRTVYTNIPGLCVDHELINGGDNQGLQDWYKWAKPGALIVFDEVQRFWKPRANGSRVPPDIEALETHRHMGVDFILVTQNVALVERNIHSLAGRHLHVRRVGNFKMAMVYEWDHVSRNLLYSNAMRKVPWRYDRKVFKLYKSAEVHTKQPRSMPAVLWFLLAGFLALSYLGPSVYARLSERAAGGKPAAEARVKADTKAKPVMDSAPRAPAAVASAPLSAASSSVGSAPVFAGCVASKNRCSCFDSAGNALDRDVNACRAMTSRPAAVLAGGTFPEPPAPALVEPSSLNLVPLESGPGLVYVRQAWRTW
ncbi:MAG: zonular occludens toxin domain-containing protein [Acidovorax sp.]|uniref:zonular occludens toxin domain-containing protein n=1 Tax=Acidovorax sp. TaxID=1872122 RepID=UPI0039E45469